MCTASIYLWDQDEHFEHKGFNMGRADPCTAFNRVDFVGDGEPVEGDSTVREFRFHIVSCALTQHDFANPEEEAKNILLGLINRGLSSRPGNGDGKVQVYLWVDSSGTRCGTRTW